MRLTYGVYDLNPKQAVVVIMKGILGRKVGMTQVFDPETGIAIPVTVIQAGPCHVLQVRTPELDGYSAVQLGYLDKPRRLAKRSERGHVTRLSSKRSKRLSAAGVEMAPKAKCEPKRFVREFRGVTDGAEVGQEVTVETFAEVKAVDVCGTSKGHGFTGVMKRYHFGGMNATHGAKKVHRSGGSTSAHSANRGKGAIKKGKKMAGQHGNARVTARNLKVVRIDSENNLLVIRGAIPGPNGGYVIIRETNKVT
jgi:large subunit ribosomal protein L3